eukprot:Hpha_TRINITY_DN16434_c1_g1::TRINITY_DN16434_c1_g1_i12::g.162406::m.162406
MARARQIEERRVTTPTLDPTPTANPTPTRQYPTRHPTLTSSIEDRGRRALAIVTTRFTAIDGRGADARGQRAGLDAQIETWQQAGGGVPEVGRQARPHVPDPERQAGPAPVRGRLARPHAPHPGRQAGPHEPDLGQQAEDGVPEVGRQARPHVPDPRQQEEDGVPEVGRQARPQVHDPARQAGPAPGRGRRARPRAPDLGRHAEDGVPEVGRQARPEESGTEGHRRDVHAPEPPKGPSPEDMDRNFTHRELAMAIGALGSRKAPGTDGVQNEFLDHLGPKGRSELLRILNRLWRGALFPQAWKESAVTPIVKKGEERDLPNAYRPIHLTSCLAKLFERLIMHRLRFLAEQLGWVAEQQGGFQRGRSTEEQIGMLLADTLDAVDGGGQVASLFVDFRKAYDNVSHLRLVRRLEEVGASTHCVRWVISYLRGRSFVVQADGHKSQPREMHKGIPQGTVLGPFLFLIYINDIVAKVEKVSGTACYLYADDLATLVHAPSTARLQKALSQVTKELDEWSTAADLPINMKAGKTEMLVFTKGKVTAQLAGGEIRQVDEYKYLGLNLDRLLSLEPHAGALVASMENNLRVLRDKQWHLRTQHLRVMYLAYAFSKLTYAIGAWWPSCSKSAKDSLVKKHKEAALLISGCSADTRLGVRYREAGLEELQRKAQTAVGSLYVRIRRMSKYGSFKVKKTGAPTWRTAGHDIVKKLGLLDLEVEVEQSAVPPWVELTYNLTANTKLTSATKKTDAAEKRLAATEETLNSLPKADIVCYTDGSVKNPKLAEYGTGAYCICDAAGRTYEGTAPAGARTTPYIAELVALIAATQRILDDVHVPEGAEIRLLTDCQSAVEMLSRGPSHDMNMVEEKLVVAIAKLCETRGVHITLQWIPSHCGNKQNDHVDVLARDAVVDQPRGVNLRVMKQVIRLMVRKDWDAETDVAKGGIHKDHIWTLATGGRVPHFPVDPKLPRREQRLLAQLRAGKSIVLGLYQK